ncbi:MAG: hypothetical protein ACR2IE_14505 [Candidatus Sumerlaeaceae bacterium]
MTLEKGPSGQTLTYRHDLTGSADPAFFTKMDNVEPTPDGIKLKRQPDGKFPVQGIMQSMPIPTEIAIQTVGAHWRQNSPAGTGVKVELSTSRDGSTWTAWDESNPDPHNDDVSRVYPDGRPNPNYGETIGDLSSRTDNQGRLVRYRVSLTTENADQTPVIQTIALTYMDNTLPGTTLVPQKEELKE